MAEGRKGRVLVTGATSFIGSHIINLLVQEGWEVRGTVRGLNSEKTKAIRECMQHLVQDLDLVEADLKSTAGWDEACQGCDYAIHTACPVEMDAFNRDGGRYIKEPHEVKPVTDQAVNGAIYLLEAAKRTGVKRVVLTSSIAAMVPPGWTESFYPCKDGPGVFDPNAHNHTINEEVWSNEDVVIGYLYAKTKAEREAWRVVEGSSTELVCVNPAIVMGPQLHLVLKADSQTTVGMCMRQPPPGPLDGLVNMVIPVVDVRDVAKAHVRAMVLPGAAGNRYLISNRAMNAYEIGEALAPFAPMGYDVLTKKQEKCMIGLLGLCDPLMSRIYRNWGRYPKLDNRKMIQELVPEPIDMRTSVVDTALAAIAVGFFERKPGFKSDDKPEYAMEGKKHVELRAALP